MAAALLLCLTLSVAAYADTDTDTSTNTNGTSATTTQASPVQTNTSSQQTNATATATAKPKAKAVTKPQEKSLLDADVLDRPISYLRDAFTPEEEDTDVPVRSGAVMMTVKALVATLLSTIM